ASMPVAPPSSRRRATLPLTATSSESFSISLQLTAGAPGAPSVLLVERLKLSAKIMVAFAAETGAPATIAPAMIVLRNFIIQPLVKILVRTPADGVPNLGNSEKSSLTHIAWFSTCHCDLHVAADLSCKINDKR